MRKADFARMEAFEMWMD